MSLFLPDLMVVSVTPIFSLRPWMLSVCRMTPMEPMSAVGWARMRSAGSEM